jgi:hypothetical protein
VDGVIQWDAEGVVVGENTGDDVLTDIVEDYFIWELQASPDFNIYMNRLTSDGAVAEGWAENGNLICGAIANQQNAKGIMTPDGLLVVWEDLRNGADKDIYAQMVGPDGSTLWADDGIALVSEMQDQSGFEMALYDGFFYLIWEDMRNGGDYDIYMQKYDLDGNQQWTSGGIGIAVKPNQQANPTFTFNDESTLIYWDDVVNDNDINLFSQRLDYEGNLTGWDEDGLMICGAIKSQQNPLAVTDGYRYSYVIWSDFRSSGKTDIFNIYSQKLDHSLNAYNDQAIEEMININLNNYPNPFRNGTILSFDLHRSQLTDGRVNIYNVRGQKVRSLDTDDNTVYWDGRDSQGKLAASGIYMYQFVSDRLSSQAAKMIRMK